MGILVAAYSPVSRGWLTADLRKFDDLPKDDFRHRLPRFQPSVFDQNMKLAEAVEKVAKRKNVTIAQVAIAWVSKQGTIPIPGSVRSDRIAENCEVVNLGEDD